MACKLSAEGLPWDYILQGSHGALVHDLDSFTFAVGIREELLPYALIKQSYDHAGEEMPVLPRPRIEHWEMARDKDVCDLIEREAPPFWASLGNPDLIPDRLEDPGDPRCGRCPYQIQCRGAELIDSAGTDDGDAPPRRDLVPLRDEYIQRAALLKQAGALVEETRDRWRAALGSANAVSVPVVIDGREKWKNVIYRLRRGSERLDARAMESQYAALRDKAIEAGLPGAELAPPPCDFVRKGMPSRPLLLKSLLPGEPKKKGEVPENDSEGDEE
jgi:hypothetical protein